METVNSKNGNRGMDKQIIKVRFVGLPTNPTHLIYLSISSEIHVPTLGRPSVLPRTPYPAPRSEAPKSAHRSVATRIIYISSTHQSHRYQREPKTRRFRSRSSIWYPSSHLYPRGTLNLSYSTDHIFLSLALPRSSRSGTVRPRFSLVHATTARLSTCGLSAVL
jgi:hypothetical protein